MTISNGNNNLGALERVLKGLGFSGFGLNSPVVAELQSSHLSLFDTHSNQSYKCIYGQKGYFK